MLDLISFTDVGFNKGALYLLDSKFIQTSEIKKYYTAYF
jgi:hypothetical protein